MRPNHTWSAVLRSSLAAALLVGATAAAHAQQTISGRVTATAGEAIPDARVYVVGTNIAAATGSDGRYQLRNVPVGTQQIRALRIGFQEQKKSVEVAAGQQVTLDFSMSPSVIQLQEIVTTATGEQRRTEIGNSVTTLKVADKIETTPITNFQDLISGKAPGVSVVSGAIQGSAPLIRIRGANSLSLKNDPIYVIDGIRMNSGTLSSGGGQTNLSYLGSLNPEEIEDIEIVKGPSAATLYGTDAANGVVVITTKKGRSGKANWTWSAEQGVVQDKNAYLTGWALWGHKPGQTTPSRCFNSTVATGACIVDSTTSLNVFQTPGITPLANGNRSRYGAQITGGTEAVRYFIGGDFENEIGPVKMPEFSQRWFDSLNVNMRDEWIRPSAYQKSSFRANLSAAINSKFDLSVNSGFSKSDQRLPQIDNNLIGYQGAAEFNAGFRQCGLEYNCIGKKKENLNGYDTYEPGQIFQRLSQTAIQRALVSATANWRPFAWLTNDATVGVDLAERNLFRLCRFGECAAQGTDTLGFVGDLTGVDRTFSAKVASNASWQPRDWVNLKTTVGADYNNVMTQNTQVTGNQLPPGGQTAGAAAVQGAS
ncbi:MAG TPA: TonB-dependent receptor plug domain-containing protein, partial [Gemmatimonadaceae bacterium]